MPFTPFNLIAGILCHSQLQRRYCTQGPARGLKLHLLQQKVLWDALLSLTWPQWYGCSGRLRGSRKMCYDTSCTNFLLRSVSGWQFHDMYPANADLVGICCLPWRGPECWVQIFWSLPQHPSMKLPGPPKSMLWVCTLESWKQRQMPTTAGMQEALAQQARSLHQGRLKNRQQISAPDCCVLLHPWSGLGPATTCIDNMSCWWD